MKNFFIALAWSFATIAVAQNPVVQDCNFAGTKTIGTFIGQSNHTGPDTIFLCLGDSVLIKHNGDAILTGDPIPATPPGICYGFYTCPPTISGNNIQTITASPGDPCLLSFPPPVNGLYVTQAVPNGADTWFFNSGYLQQVFNGGQPELLYFAPTTIDSWTDNAFEAPATGAPPGPCVHVNTTEAFPVVYLNKIQQDLVDNSFGNDCIGKFRIRGGYPEYDLSSTYSLDISLTSDPTVKALVHIPDAINFSNISTLFSATIPGIYTISEEDGIGCGLQFQMDMSGCNAADNLVLAVGNDAGAPGEQVCVPVRIKNFDITSASVSFNWDPAHLRYGSVSNLNSAIAGFFNPVTFLNTSSISLGELGMVLYNTVSFGDPITIPDNEVLFELCFEVLDSLPSCTQVAVGSNPALISFENPLGEMLAVTAAPGNVCYAPPHVSTQEPWKQVGKIRPNPVRSGETAEITTSSELSSTARLLIRNAQGNICGSETVSLSAGENSLPVSTGSLPAGFYTIELVAGGSGRVSTYKLLIL